MTHAQDPTRASRPLPRSLVALAALVSGFVLARETGGVASGVGFGIAGVLCAGALMARGWVCKVLLTAAVAAFGHGWMTFRVHEHSGEWLGASGNGIVRVEGVVRDTPREWRVERHPMHRLVLEEARAGFELRVTGVVEGEAVRRASGLVWVRIAGGLEGAEIRAGDRVRLTGVLEVLEAARNPGERDRRMWGVQDGRVGWLRLTGPTLIEGVGARGAWEGAESWWLRSRAWLADRAHEVLLGAPVSEGGGEAEGRALLGALVLGDDDRALREVRGSFNRLGLAHVLTISGFHLTVMTGVVLVMLRALGDLGRWEPMIAAGLILAYLAILPFNAPVWRSGLMVLGLLTADALGRRHDRLAVLGWIAAAILVYRPLEAWSIGFQLSFGLVALLVWLADFVHGRIFGIRLRGLAPEPERGVAGWAAEGMKRLTSTSVLCGLAATPIVAYHTGLVSPAAVITSIVLVPPITALLIAAYVVLLLGVVAPPLAGIASEMLGVLAAWTAAGVKWIDGLPGTSVDVPRISLALAVTATGVVLYWFVRGRKRDRLGWVLAGVMVAWTIGEFRASTRLSSSVLVRVDTLAVGDGTCHLVRSGREALMWDCGSLEPGVGETLVPRAARALGVLSVPTVVVTHANVDHFNGILDAAGPLGVRLVVTGEAVAARAAARPASAEAYLLAGLEERGIEVRVVGAGDRLELGEVWVEFISPARGSVWGTDNDASLVARIVPRGGAEDEETAVLLTGDIQGGAIGTIERERPRFRARVVEAPHHGSARDESVRFVMKLGPEVVVQSTGPSRAGEAVWGAVRAQSRFYCTAIDGAAWVKVGRDGGVRSGSVRNGAGLR